MIISIITLLKRSSKSWRKMKVWCKVFTTSLKAALDSPSTRNSRIHIQKHSFYEIWKQLKEGMDGNHLVVNKLFFVVVFSYPHGLGHDLCQMAVNGDRRVKKSEAGQVNLQHMRPFSSLFKFTFFLCWETSRAYFQLSFDSTDIQPVDCYVYV